MRLSLRSKWTLALLSVAIVPMLVLGLLVLDIQRDGLSRAEKELEAAVVDEAASGIIASIDSAADVATRSATIFADESIDLDARTRLMTDLALHTPSVEGIAFFDPEHHFVDALIPTGPRRDEVLASLRSEAPRDGHVGFRVLAPPANALRYEGLLQAQRGSIVVAISKSHIDARLRDLSQNRFGAPDRVYLVDESVHVLAGGNNSNNNNNNNNPLPILEAAGFKTKTPSFTTPLVSTTEFRDGVVEKVGTVRTMPNQHWALVVERPTLEAFGALATARQAFVWLLMVFAVMATIAGALIVRRVVGPINVLMALIKRYARRDFAARSLVKSGDELESLGSSLEGMADDLTKSEHEIKKRTRIEENLRRYMPAEAADAAASDAQDALQLGGAKHRVTVVFADVVAFTGFAENASPEKAVAFLNELFTILSEIIFRHDGMVDKFIGDCVMAVFRPSTTTKNDDVARALAAAEDMHAFVASNLPRWREAYAFTVELGIGVSTGDVLIGNLGSANRLEYTVIGDAVNVAARLESLAGPRQTLATQEVVDACPLLTFTSLGSHALRGKAKSVEVYEVTS